MSKAFDEWFAKIPAHPKAKHVIKSSCQFGWNAAIEAAAKMLDEKDYGDLAHDLRHSLPAEEK